MVWKCPVCGKTKPAQPETCPVCGYDESADREKYPTLICPAKSVSAYSGKMRQAKEPHRQKEWEEQERRERQLQEDQEEQVRGEQAERQEKWKKEKETRPLEHERRKRPERKEQKEEKMPVPVHRAIVPTEKSLVKKSFGKSIWFVFGAIVLLMSPLNVIFLLFLLLKMIPFRVKERKLDGGIYTGTATSFGFSPKKRADALSQRKCV